MANLATITNNILADSGIDPIDLIVGTGTINYIPKFTSEGSIGNSIMTESGANILISGNIVLNAGNYNNYAPTLTGGGASGLWSINITGNSGTSTQANAAYLVNGTSGGAIQSWDIRSITSYSMTSYRMGFGFTSWDNNNTAPYADYLHLRSYSDASGGNDNLIMFLKSGIGMRIYQQPFNSTTPYTNYVDVLHSSNYTNYAVQTTTQSNWNNYNVIANVIGLLAWKNYGNNHVIFDASNSTSPSGTPISSTDSQNGWAATYPTLMGWNGSQTYGVRVDRARLADNADTVDGFHATNAAGGLAYYASNGYLYAPAWINVDNGGIFSGTNSAHFRPNPNTYGPWLISGSRNNYSGLEFDSLVNGNVALSISTSSNITGFYNTSYGWQFFWNGGTMYVYKNTYGGGAQATVLDSSNFNTWAAAVNGNTANSFNVFQLSYAATTFNPSAAPRSQMNPMSIKMWNNYFNGIGLGSDYGTVMQYYSLGDHVDTQVYFDASGGSWYRSASYLSGWQGWQKYVTENGATWNISISGSSATTQLLTSSGSFLTQFGNGTIGYTYAITAGTTGLFPSSDNSNATLTINRHPGDYYSQLGFSSNGEIYYRRFSATVINTTLPWVTLLTSNNYNLYAPTLTGVGASGTWNISITGSSGSVSFNNLTDKTGGTGTYQTSGDFRAPIFYDSDNTNYYVDPNGLSRMYRLQIIGDWAGANPNEGAINIRGAYPSMTFRNTVSNNMWLRHMDGSGDIQHYFANGVDGASWTIKHSMFSDGTFASQGSMRAPIFYDINDTNYYLDPNSTSNLYYVIGLNFRVGNAIYFGGGNNYFNWDGRINSNVGIQSQSDMRAPIFYDINDTNYYVDPNGLSVLRSVQIGAYNQYSITLPSPSNNYGNGRIYIRIQPVGGRIVSFKISISSTWNWGPAFGFVSADVSYYCDGTSLIYPQVSITSATGQAANNLTIGNLVIENGYISLPIYSANTNSIFVKFEGAPSFDWNLITTSGWESVAWPGSAVVNIPGALATGGNITMAGNLVATQSWVNSQGFVTGGPYLPLSGGTVSGATIFNGNVTWFNGQGSMMALENQGTFARFAFNGLDFYDWQYGISMTISNGDITANNSFRAPIFYDSNDTTFYVDPNATSNIYKIRVGNGAEVPGLIGMGASYLYGMGINNAYTAVHAHSSANGVALGSFDGTTFTAKMYVNHDGNAYAVSSFRAPIFYDSADTNYYLDPNSSSVLNQVTTNGRIYSNEWIQFSNYTGLYSPNNGAHFRPNTGSYGPWLITGTRNGWSGIEFESLANGNVSMMIGANSNETGFHNNSYGWQFRWTTGTMYVFKGTYGGGTQATVWDSVNAPISVSATPNTLALRSGDGDIAVRELTMTVGVQSFTPSSMVGIYPTTNQAVKVTASGTRDFLNVPTRTGGDASGTWGISITGGATYLNSSNYIQQTGSNGSWNADFQATPAGTARYGGDVGANATNNPGNSWWIQQNFRHTNSSNYWGVQVAWGWEDNANRLATRSISGGTFGSWVYYLNSSNYGSYALPLSGGTMTGAIVSNATEQNFTNFTARNTTSAGSMPNHLFYYIEARYNSGSNGTNVYHWVRSSWEYNITNNYHDITFGATYSGASYVNLLRVSADGNIYATNSFRAPIFYDSADTTYYVDPNGGSYLRGRVLVTGGHSASALRVFLRADENGAGTGVAALEMWCSEPGQTWAWGGFGYNVTNDNGSPGGFGRINTNFGQAYMRFSDSGDLYFYNTNTSGTRATTARFAYDGSANFYYSVLAPGFYESSDMRIKELIENSYIPNGIESVTARLYKKNGKIEIGYYAQDVQDILPSAVSVKEDGYLNLSYREVHTAKIAYLEKKIKELEEKLNSLY
jgi:hypothetical protein